MTHNKQDDTWVSYLRGKIYNISQYQRESKPVQDEEYFLKYAGKDITRLIQDRIDFDCGFINDKYLMGYIVNTKELSKILDLQKKKNELKQPEATYDYTAFINKVPREDKSNAPTEISKDFEKHHFLDLSKPLFWQMITRKFSRDFYVDQVHRPRHYGEDSAPSFGNFLEPFTKTPWYMIPITWGPVVSYNFIVASSNMNIPLTCFLFVVAIFVWTLIAYCLHRFLFYLDDWVPQHNIFYTLHFLLHGIHHYLPMDKNRLVVPPVLFCILCIPFYKLTFQLLPTYWAYAGFAGGLFGYICYDITHYSIHHAKLPKPLRRTKQYHLEHHYKNYQLGFGVTSYFWDIVFGTYLGPNAPVSEVRT